MKILKMDEETKFPIEKKCQRCGTKFQYEYEDISWGFSGLDMQDYPAIKCPQCGVQEWPDINYLTKEKWIKEHPQKGCLGWLFG